MPHLRLIFMGTPEFAVPSLDILVRYNYPIVAVVTAPDKPAGRGQRHVQSPVKKYALERKLNLLQPPNLKDQKFLHELRSLKADLQVIVAFRMLPETVWNMPPMGTINLHASLLPQYRGAAPINWAIINGEKETGLTTFFLKHEIDTGNIIYQEKMAIGSDETAGQLHNRMKEKGAALVLRTAQAIENGNVTVVEQKMSGTFKKAPKISKADCRIDWKKPINEIYNFIRGLSPSPGAWTMMDGAVLKIYKSEKVIGKDIIDADVIHTDHKNYLKVAAKGGHISLLEVQQAGKTRMTIREFLNGYKGHFEIKS